MQVEIHQRRVLCRAAFHSANKPLLNSKMLYTYRTVEYRGTIELRDKTVVARMWHCGTRWEREVPYLEISPYPTIGETTSSATWLAAIISPMAIVGGVLGYGQDALSSGASLFVVAAGIALMAFAWCFRRETWVSYSATSGDARIALAKNSRSGEQFSAFCKEFDRRLHCAAEDDCSTVAVD